MLRNVALVRGIATLLLSLTAPVPVDRPDSPPVVAPRANRSHPDTASDVARYDAIDAYVARQLDQLRVPGASLAIVEGDRIVHERGFGWARPGGGRPTPQTPFVLGSTTKSFTALAVMQLVEAGMIVLDDPVQRYLPWFRVADPQASAAITVRQLLIQTSGLSTQSGWSVLADFDTSADAAEHEARGLAMLRLTRPPGFAFGYSNMNYILLGLIVEAASGERYATYVQNHIFDPLEMRHSYASRSRAWSDGLAIGSRFWFGRPVVYLDHDPDAQFPRGSLAAGQLISSAEDMSHYLIGQLSGGRYGGARILSSAGMAEMHRPEVAFTMLGESGQYGMGWFVDDRGPTRILWHDGVVPDFFTYMAIVPERHMGLVLLMNADGFLMSNTSLLEVGTGAAALLARAPPPPVRWGIIIPWMHRGLLLIPVLQLVGIALTVRRVRRWRRAPESRPSRRRTWILHLALPAIPNLLLASAAILLVSSPLAGFLFLFGPDISWIALICGGFAGIWLVARSALVLWAVFVGPFAVG